MSRSRQSSLLGAGAGRVHVVFKTHLDVGFTDLAGNVVRRYFEHFIPAALRLGAHTRESGRADRFIWTTGSWLIYEYLERSTPRGRRAMEAGIDAGDIAWHALPFTTWTEMMDPSLFRWGLGLSAQLDRRFGRRTIAGKMTDVPGHTRSMVPLLADAGVRFLHIGLNSAWKAPATPPIFTWRAPDGSSVAVMVSAGSYGDAMAADGSRDVLAFAHTGDNHGPQDPASVAVVFDQLRTRFPGARVFASTMDEYARRLLASPARLPVVTQEIGDTWIFGLGADPLKVARFRALCRLRTQWEKQGRVFADDPAYAAFSRELLLVPEHTWGLDMKTFLADYGNYSSRRFALARADRVSAASRAVPAYARLFDRAPVRGRFALVESAWREQRQYINRAIRALGKSPLAAEARRALREVAAVRPGGGSWQPATVNEQVETPRLKVRFDPKTGAIISLIDKATGRQWSGGTHPLGLFRYETFAQSDYDRLLRQAVIHLEKTGFYAIPDFTKPGIAAAGAEHHLACPSLRGLDRRQMRQGQCVRAELVLPRVFGRKYGAPGRVWIEYRFPPCEPVVEIVLQWFDKPATRLPEAMWLSFVPRLRRPEKWQLDKMGLPVSPLDIVKDGGVGLHGIGAGVSYAGPEGGLTLESLDAPLVAPGEPRLLTFDNHRPRLNRGMHFNLHNNLWGTNFPAWYEENGRCRFRLAVRAAGQAERGRRGVRI